jgi:hypothetical protein
MRVAWRERLRSRSAGAVAVAAAGLVLASCSPAPASGPGTTHASTGPRSGSVISLTSISTLKTLFNRDSGHPRLVLIFSPT